MTSEVWVTFQNSDAVPEGVSLQVRLKDGRRTTATYEKRGRITAWWLPSGEPTGLYNVVAFCRTRK